MDDLVIKIQHKQRGQPGPYQPHTYESLITIEGKRSWDRLLEGQLKDIVRGAVHHFTEDESDGSPGDYYQPRLKELRKISEGPTSAEPLGPQQEVWIARVECPFTD